MTCLSTVGHEKELTCQTLFAEKVLVDSVAVSYTDTSCELIILLNSPARKLRCCGAQLSRNCGRFLDFRLQISLIIFHFGEIWGKLGPLSTRNLSFQKFVAVCPKNSTSCLHAYFHSRCHWVMARLMTLQRSLQYSLSLSWTKTLFRKISNFCTSLGLYNIDRRCFVVRCQFSKVPKDQSNILHPKWAKLCATLAQPFHFFAQLLPHV